MAKNNGEGQYTEAHNVRLWDGFKYVEVSVEMSIAYDTLLHALTRRAMLNKSRKASALRGAITVTLKEQS